MKRSKIFLGVTTSLLAVAGLAASRHAKFNQRNQWYITQESTHQYCVPIRALCSIPFSLRVCTIFVPTSDPGVSTITGVYTKGALTGGEPTPADGINNCGHLAYTIEVE